MFLSKKMKKMAMMKSGMVLVDVQVQLAKALSSPPYELLDLQSDNLVVWLPDLSARGGVCGCVISRR